MPFGEDVLEGGVPSSIVLWTWLSRNVNSRHLPGVIPAYRDFVSLGGKCVCVSDQPFGQQGREQFSVEPCFRAPAATFWQMAELRD